MMVSELRTGYPGVVNAAVSLSIPRACEPIFAYPTASPAMSLSRPLNGAFYQVAVARCAHDSGKHADRLRTVGARTPDHLVGYGVEAIVAPMTLRDTSTHRVRERQTGVVELLVRKALRVVPETQLVGSRQTGRLRVRRIGRRLVDCILHLADEQRAVVQIEVRAVAVLLLRVADIAARQIAVEHTRQHRPGVGRFGAYPHTQRREWIGLTASRLRRINPFVLWIRHVMCGGTVTGPRSGKPPAQPQRGVQFATDGRGGQRRDQRDSDERHRQNRVAGWC